MSSSSNIFEEMRMWAMAEMELRGRSVVGDERIRLNSCHANFGLLVFLNRAFVSLVPCSIEGTRSV